jgi:hypothetical protein
MRSVAAAHRSGEEKAGRAFGFVKIRLPKKDRKVTRERFTFCTDKAKLKAAGQRDGHYLLRSNLTAEDPAVLWTRYVQLTQIESVFRSLKSEVGIRPIDHQLEHRADAHVFTALLAYCLQVTLKTRRWNEPAGLPAGAIAERRESRRMKWLTLESKILSAAAYETIRSKSCIYGSAIPATSIAYFDFPIARQQAFLSAESKGRFSAILGPLAELNISPAIISVASAWPNSTPPDRSPIPSLEANFALKTS